MNEFIEQNRGLLRTYCVGARIIGWVLLVVPPISTAISLAGNSALRDSTPRLLYMLAILFTNYLILGIVVLGAAQFIRYLYESDYHPGWLLRNGAKVLYACAIIVVVGSIVVYFYPPFLRSIVLAGKNTSLLGGAIRHIYALVISQSIPAVAKALLLVGMAQILRRVMPVIEESKTLV